MRKYAIGTALALLGGLCLIPMSVFNLPRLFGIPILLMVVVGGTLQAVGFWEIRHSGHFYDDWFDL